MPLERPAVTVITPLGRPELDLLEDAGLSVLPLREQFGKVQWVVAVTCAENDAPRADMLTQVRNVTQRVGLPAEIVDAPGASPGQARNIALERAAAPWIIALDSDDRILASGMCALLRMLGADVGAAWAAGRAIVTDLKGRQVERTPPDYFAAGRIGIGEYWKARLELGGPPFFATATVAATESVIAVGGWPNARWMRAEDTALWGVLTSLYNGRWWDGTVYQYRRHLGSVSADPTFYALSDRVDEISDMIARGSTALPDPSRAERDAHSDRA